MDKKKIILCVAETIIVNIIIYYFFFKIQPNQDVYLQLNPHPLFLLCIVMGLRYGNYLGLISAVISSAFYIKVFLEIYDDLILLLSYLTHYKYILLFFWAAMIFGVFKDNHKTNMEKISEENQLIKDNYNQLSKTYKLTRKIQEELKKQIINSEESILYLYEIATRLETLESEEIYTETIGILSKFLRADTVSVYSYNEASGYLRLKIRMGDINTGNRSMLVEESYGFSKVVLEKQVVRWSDVKDDDFPLMSAPIIQTGKVLAIVSIEHMDFDKLSEYAFQLFKLIIEWVNKAIEQAIYVDGLRESKYIAGMKLMYYESFKERLKEEERRKKDFGMDFGLLKFKINNINLEVINERMQRFLRTVDVVSYDLDQKILYVLLPATPAEKLDIIEERILNSLDSELVQLKLNIGASVGDSTPT
ncbi:MAG: GAF domain-containing protein, partial [Halanaerobiales bacterium]|nr:GAF domain-containing protein [Halanaerobiales bacterium]